MLKNKHSKEEVLQWLTAKGPDLNKLYKQADSLRQQIMGDEVFLRGILEFSNYCNQQCDYCGIRAGMKELLRYRMSEEEIIDSCKTIEKYGQTTVVLQSGEDPFYTTEILGQIICKIKEQTSLVVTVSVGERSKESYKYWLECGMDRYLLRYETSNKKFYAQIHNGQNLDDRLACIKNLQELGVQTGSGFLIGLPGQSLEDIASELLFCSALNLEMIGVGPFIPHQKTPLGKAKNPFDPEFFFKVIAILRLLNPKAHIPATTAFDAVNLHGRNLALKRGANVFMPNSTPQKYRKYYQLYPGKPCIDESSEDCAKCVVKRIQNLGRVVGQGPGHSKKLI